MTCNLCGQVSATVNDAIAHMQEMHPVEFGAGYEKWPDGSPVVIDRSDYTADEIGGVL